MQWKNINILSASERIMHLMPLFSVKVSVVFRRVCRPRKANLPNSNEPINIFIQPRGCTLQTRKGLPQSNSQRSKNSQSKDPKYASATTLVLFSSRFPGCSVPLTMRKLGCPAQRVHRGGPMLLKSQSFILCEFLNRQYSK